MNTFAPALALVLATCALPTPVMAQNATVPVTAPARFSVEVVGQGPDVVLVPGLATPREVWRPIAEELKGRYRVHLIQVRGFGEPAGANAQGPVLAPLVAELAAYIREQRMQKPAVIGHSLGGLAALMLAADHADVTGRVMIVDALPFYGVLAARPGMTVTAESIEPQARMLRDQMAGTYGQPADARVAEATAASQALTPAARAAVAGWVAAADPRVTGQLAYEDMTTDMRARLADVRVPVTLVYPWNESYPTKAQADGFYQGEYASLRGTQFVPIGPSGHFVMLDDRRAMSAAIATFLSAVEPAR